MLPALPGDERRVLESKKHSWKGERREMEPELENRSCDDVAAAIATIIFFSPFLWFWFLVLADLLLPGRLYAYLD